MIKFITYIVSTLFTYGFGLISKKFKWNEAIPIPVQNILIGMLVFIVSCLILMLLRQDINVTDVIEQIVASLGGAGTATLAYDTKKVNKEEN